MAHGPFLSDREPNQPTNPRKYTKNEWTNIPAQTRKLIKLHTNKPDKNVFEF